MKNSKMALKPDQERLKALLKETITLLCKNGLNYSQEFSVEALIGITLDKDDVLLVSINETIQTESYNTPTTSEPDVKSRRSASSTPKRDSNPPTPSLGMECSSESPRPNRDRKRAYSDAYHRDSSDSSSPSKRAMYEPTQSGSDVVVIKEESDSGDDTCIVSKSCSDPFAPPIIPHLGDLGGINFDQAQLIPVGSSIPGCSSWSAMGPGPPSGPSLGMGSPQQQDFQQMPPPLGPPRTQGAETELVPGSGVYIPTTVYSALSQEYFPKGSKLVRRLVHTIFPDDHELANSSCLGKRGDSCHKGLDQRKVEAIKDFTLCRYPEMQTSEVIQAINVCCCQARHKLKGRQGASEQSCAPPGRAQCSYSLPRDTDIYGQLAATIESSSSSTGASPRLGFAVQGSSSKPSDAQSSSTSSEIREELTQGPVPPPAEESVDEIIKDSVNLSFMDLTK